MEAKINVYDKSKIGKIIAHGWDHLVYEYGEDKVIKFSYLEILQSEHGRQKAIEDYLTCRRFFGNYILNTEIISLPNGKKTLKIQPKIFGHYLTKKDLSQSSVLDQFKEIIKAEESMVAAGCGSLDLVGHKGVFRRRLSNIFVTPDNKLTIFDTMLISFKNLGISYPLFFIGWNISKWRQKYLIKYFLS